MKKYIAVAIVAIGSVALMRPSLAQQTQTSLSSNDKQYLTKAAEGSSYEFQVAELGVQKATNSATEEYARRLLNDHTMFNAELMQLAHQKGMTLPVSINAQDRAKIDRLMQLEGMAFDREFAMEMVRINSSDISESQREAGMTNDPAIKAFINEFTGTDEQHLEIARNLTGNSGGVSPTDRQYLSKDAEGSEYEFQVAQLGAEKAANSATQQYAFRLLHDHAMLNADLMQLAHQKGLTLPVSIKAQDKMRIENLMQLNGAAFDSAFAREMVRINSSDISDSQRESQMTKDPEIQAFLAKFAPTDEEHLRLARNLMGGSTAQK